jgi:hypothetical protein
MVSSVFCSSITISPLYRLAGLILVWVGKIRTEPAFRHHPIFSRTSWGFSLAINACFKWKAPNLRVFSLWIARHSLICTTSLVRSAAFAINSPHQHSRSFVSGPQVKTAFVHCLASEQLHCSEWCPNLACITKLEVTPLLLHACAIVHLTARRMQHQKSIIPTNRIRTHILRSFQVF